jgi:endonuclease YncB( thermonuclease family)
VPLTRMTRMTRMTRLARALAIATAVLGGCSSIDELRGTQLFYDRDTLSETLAKGEAGIVLGEYPLGENAVVDGDTVRVEGLDATLRLLGIDAEETFKSEKDLRAYEAGFAAYMAKKRGTSDRPVKAATPLGMDAKKFAEEFFRGVTHVRLERDHPKEIRDAYDRFLAYVFVDKGGEWVNFNVECVRAGMSPYFSKYGYSRRFHEDFVAAQEEARAAKRGIWDPAKEHYPDYEERLVWWDGRAEVIAKFEREAAERPDWIILTNWDALDRLSAMEGQEVVLLGGISEVRPRKGRAPARVMLGRRMFSDFPLVFFDDDVLESSGADRARGEFVRVRGTVTRYHFKKKKGQRGPGESQLQIEIKRPEQITLLEARARSAGGAAAPEPAPPADAPSDVPPHEPPPLPVDDDGALDPAPAEPAPAEPSPDEPVPTEVPPAPPPPPPPA